MYSLYLYKEMTILERVTKNISIVLNASKLTVRDVTKICK